MNKANKEQSEVFASNSACMQVNFDPYMSNCSVVPLCVKQRIDVSQYKLSLMALFVPAILLLLLFTNPAVLIVVIRQ